jgi:hypothetical protein
VQEVPGSNPGSPTKVFKDLALKQSHQALFGVQMESNMDASEKAFPLLTISRYAHSRRIESS